MQAGLCEHCKHVQVIYSRRGSRFLLCRKSETDPAFSKYPRLPVLSCDGFVPAGPTPGGADLKK
ncbi:hypothetical protein DCC62_08600 [candidate division KSB1 bacterium]|nr:MAG: hypothetical protein DCC62_08600 [candidate division KSB1 bacterium]